MNVFNKNNFHLIRLLAILQILIHHLIVHFGLLSDYLIFFRALTYFEGLPILFFISGFLISASYEHHSHLLEYFKHRFLRIYPALFVCIVLSLWAVYLSGYFDNRSISLSHFFLWFLGQVTFFQFYNPSFMRDFGVGVLNGSLWTIVVEVQFYFFLPILYSLFKWLNIEENKRKISYILLALTLLSIFGHYWLYYMRYEHTEIYKHSIFWKLYNVSIIPWLWMFLTGIFFQKHFHFFHRLLKNRAIPLFIIYVILMLIGTQIFRIRVGNATNPLYFFIFVLFAFSFAYSWTDLSKKLLKYNDISYGLYIYHMPVINFFVYYGYIHKKTYLLIAFAIIILLGILSWFLIEKPILKLKKHSLNPLFAISSQSSSSSLR